MPRLVFLVCCAFVLAGALAVETQTLPTTTGVDKTTPVAVKVEESTTPKVEVSKASEVPSKSDEEPKEKTESPKPEPTVPAGTATPSDAPVPPKTTTVAPEPPKTTTVAPSTTVAPPTPLPPPSKGKWVVNETGKVCVILRMTGRFNVTYRTKDNKTASVLFDLPAANSSSNATGYCGKDEQNLTISWRITANKNTSVENLTLHFLKNDTAKKYSLHHLELYVSPTVLPNATFDSTVLLVHENPAFPTGLSNSYRCVNQQQLRLNGTNNVTGVFTVADLQYQAFRSGNSTTFGLATDCAFVVPDVVPIAVGCALAGLVVIVLGAYLVSRRRSQARGYLSM